MNELLLFTQWFWLGIAALMIILDVTVGTSFFLLWLGIIAIVMGTVVWIFPTIGWEFQVLLFAVGSITSIVFWRRYLRKHPVETDRPLLNRRSEQYIGRSFTLVEAIVNGRGKIRVDDSTWQVEGPDLPIGTTVKVISANGIILKVKPIHKSDEMSNP